jgi:hypothetical protein
MTERIDLGGGTPYAPSPDEYPDADTSEWPDDAPTATAAEPVAYPGAEPGSGGESGGAGDDGLAVCRAAPICRALLQQVNTRYPGRNRAKDGIVGDAAHMAGTGDHTCKTTLYYNPGHGRYLPGYAHAVDLDERGWPSHEFYAFTLAEAIAGRRPWIKYSIYEDVLRDRYRGWAIQRGYGHFDHQHHSIDGGRRTAWTLKEVDWFAGWDTSPFNPNRLIPGRVVDVQAPLVFLYGGGTPVTVALALNDRVLHSRYLQPDGDPLRARPWSRLRALPAADGIDAVTTDGKALAVVGRDGLRLWLAEHPNLYDSSRRWRVDGIGRPGAAEPVGAPALAVGPDGELLISVFAKDERVYVRPRAGGQWRDWTSAGRAVAPA